MAHSSCLNMQTLGQTIAGILRWKRGRDWDEGRQSGVARFVAVRFARAFSRGRVALAVKRLVPIVSAVTAVAAGSDPAWDPAVQVSPGGWGRMTPLAGDDWLCVSTLFPAGQPSQLGLYLSTNRCASWTARGVVNAPGRKLDNGNLLRLPNGNLLLTGRSLIDEESYRLPVYRSNDGGRTWTRIGNIDANEGAPGSLKHRGLWEPHLYVLGDGAVAVAYSNEKHDGFSQVISARVSRDDGATWGPEIWAVAQPGGGSLRPGMPVVTALPGGGYFMSYEVVGSGNADVYAKSSADGVNWPAGLGTRVPGHHAGPFVVAMPDGRLWVTSCQNQISWSEDRGQSWQRADPPPWAVGFRFTWPALYAVGANQVASFAVTNGLRLRTATIPARRQWPARFVDDFTGSADPDWTTYGGAFRVESSGAVLDNDVSSGMALNGEGFWSNGVLAADVMLETPGQAGLMFRTTNADGETPDSAFGYYAGLDTAGAVIFGRLDGQWTGLAQAAMPVVTNRWYRLWVRMNGPSLRVFVDDLERPVISISDPHFRRGQIGVRAHRSRAVFRRFSYENQTMAGLHRRRETGRRVFSASKTDLPWWQFSAPALSVSNARIAWPGESCLPA